jgi:uncharacterized protein
MIATVVRVLWAAALLWFVLAPDARAQQQPSAAAVAAAKEIVQLKGAIGMFDPVLVGVVEHTKNLLMQGNPTLAKELNDTATKLRTDLAPRREEIHTELARAYASQFTEQELKDALAFYKTPLGKKLIDAEPKAMDEVTKRVDAWADKFAQEVNAKFRDEMKKKGHNLL